jgi:3-hydroxybutyrate dehydrogenase
MVEVGDPSPIDMRLTGRVAIVTGAASGIGREIARTFAHAGAAVAIADVDGAGARSVAAQIMQEGGQALAVQMDVTLESEVDAAMAHVERQFGRLDILVSNAGIQIVSPLEALSFADWKRMLAVHLDGAFLTTRAALRPMYRQSGGCVIYMGSVHSKEASLLKAPYVTAKHGLVGLAKVVAKEGAPHGVRSHVICPGFVRTPLVDQQIPQQAQALGLPEQEVVRKVMLGETVDGEFTTLEEVARVSLFLAAFDSKALTGQSLMVSHGWFMQ